MSVAEAVAVALLGLAVLTEVVCVVGVAWMHSPFDALHFSAAAAGVAPVLVAVAVVLTGFPRVSATVECVTACLVLAVLNPLVTSATGRAGRRLDFGDLAPRREEWQR